MSPRKKTARHGTETMYKNYDCRCEDCITAAREAARDRMRRRRSTEPGRLMDEAYRVAMQRLREAHPNTWRSLLREEQARRGVPIREESA